MIKTAIIDDEIGVQKVITGLLTELCPDIEIVGFANDVDSGQKLLQNNDVDLLFLDVKMPGGSGFDLLSRVGEISFKVIFITAFAQHAIKAIRFAALDYILKPINSKELIEAVERFRQNKEPVKNITSMLQNINNHINDTKIGISSVGLIEYIRVTDIVRFESEGGYTTVHVVNNKKIVSTRSIKEYDDLLTEHGFFRVHRSHLINLSLIKAFKRSNQNTVTMVDDSEVEVSRLKRNEFFTVLSKINI